MDFSALLINEEKDHRVTTAAISEESLMLRRLLNREHSAGTASLDHQRHVSLFVRGIAERIMLMENCPTFLGRFDINPGQKIDLDLTPYGAVEHGVSRVHARLDLKGQNVYITDLGSTNGTFVGGTQLQSYQPHLLRNMDQIVFGGLATKIVFM